MNSAEYSLATDRLSRREPGSAVTVNRFLAGGKIRESHSLKTKPILSPVPDIDGFEMVNGLPKIAEIVQATAEDALRCINAAHEAFENSEWRSLGWAERAKCLTNLADRMRGKRDKLAGLIMLEIAKTEKDAYGEVDRTIEFIEATVREMHAQAEREKHLYKTDYATYEERRIKAKGPTLVLAPSNYPLNETFTTLISALAVGNTVVAKAARQGNLVLAELHEDFQECFPPGVVNAFSGQRNTVQAIAGSQKVKIVSFFGSTAVGHEIKNLFAQGDQFVQPELAMEAKNRLVVLPDTNIDEAVEIAIKGCLSYNGQRCTAIKHILVHQDIAEEFLAKLANRMGQLKIGVPWEKGVDITPLLSIEAAEKQEAMVQDALGKGARIIYTRADKIDRSYYPPTLVAGVIPGMRLFDEEQYGTVVPVTTFNDIEEVIDIHRKSKHGQQAAIATGNPESDEVNLLALRLLEDVHQVWVNEAPGRGPDNKPFGAAKQHSGFGSNQDVRGSLKVFGDERIVVMKAKSVSPERKATARPLSEAA